MILPQLESLAQVFTAPILNSLPEGILIAGFVWLLLRLLPRQNSGTRFAVWFIALLTVVTLPFAGSFGTAHSVLALVGSGQPLLTLPDRWALLLLVTWLLVAFFAMLRLAFAVWRVRGLLKSCVSINAAEVDPAIAQLVADFSSARSITVATSEKLSVPAAIGFLKPMIVVPRWALGELSPQELNAVLLHEFAHVERGDGWTNLFQKIVRVLFCFHPAVWWIESRLSLEREMACDDYVLAETDDPRGYAKCLIDLLERNLPGKALAMAQAAVQRTHEAALRLSQILDLNRPKTKRVWKPALGLIGVFSLLCLVVFPQTRQLVGFEPNQQPAYDAAALPAFPASAIVAAAVVPAAMHSSSSPVARGRSAAPVVSCPKQHRSTPSMAAARTSAPPARVLNVQANEMAMPITETVLVIRTANQVGPNAWQWSVHVWRVTLVPDQTERVPVVSKKT
jgi:beta-lactamase regulating signal transducer with metallopeptidase domain